MKVTFDGWRRIYTGNRRRVWVQGAGDRGAMVWVCDEDPPSPAPMTVMFMGNPRNTGRRWSLVCYELNIVVYRSCLREIIMWWVTWKLTGDMGDVI
jgi:hypothetical protein